MTKSEEICTSLMLTIGGAPGSSMAVLSSIAVMLRVVMVLLTACEVLSP